jgi:non-homologous end joining protein Ku
LILHALFYSNEVRAEEEYQADSQLVGPKELDLAKVLVRALAAPFDESQIERYFRGATPKADPHTSA